MLIKTENRAEVVRGLLNQWLKDNTVYCNNCDSDYLLDTPCCEHPDIGTNYNHLQKLVCENQILKDEMKYNTGKSTDTGAMRLAFRIPPRAYTFIENYFKAYGEKFPRDNKDLHSLMRTFNALCTVREI